MIKNTEGVLVGNRLVLARFTTKTESLFGI